MMDDMQGQSLFLNRYVSITPAVGAFCFSNTVKHQMCVSSSCITPFSNKCFSNPLFFGFPPGGATLLLGTIRS